MNSFFIYKNHVEQIKNGGLSVFFRKISTLLRRILFGTWAIPCILIARLIRPIILIRFGTIRSDRIGHFTLEAGMQFAKNIAKTDGVIELYWLPKQTSNKHWKKMVRRNFSVHWWVEYLDYWNSALPGGGDNYRPSTNTNARDMQGVLYKSKASMKFLSHEEEEAKKWLRSHGWKDGDPFVCLLVRDSAYLSKDPKHSNTHNYSYHNYRDTDIFDYIDAIEWLADKEIMVIRMGRIMNNPISINHKKVIDYAFCDNQSDLLDVWLFANCSLCISNGSGPDMISNIYNRPLLFINYIPIAGIVAWSNSITYPKNLAWKNSGEYLTLDEHLENIHVTSQAYKDSGINVVNMTSDKILFAVKEAWGNVDGTWSYSEHDLKNMCKLLELLKKSSSTHNYFDFIHPKAKISPAFIKDNPNLFNRIR